MATKVPPAFRRLDKDMRKLVKEKVDFDQLFEDIMIACAPDAHFLEQAQAIAQTLTDILRDIRFDSNWTIRKYPGASIIIFGSNRSHTGTHKSDLDLCIILRNGQEIETRAKKIFILKDLKKAMVTRERDWQKWLYGTAINGPRFNGINVIPIEPKHPHLRRAPPILKCVSETGIAVDICVEDLEGPIVSELIKTAKARGGRVFHAMMKCGVLGTKEHFPSSTNLFFILLNFLQTREKAIFGAVNIKAIDLDTDDQMNLLNEKFKSKGSWPSMIDTFLAQANHMGWSNEASRALDLSMLKQNVLPKKDTFLMDHQTGGQTMEQTLNMLLIEFGQWLGDPNTLPSVIDAAHPQSHLFRGQICEYGRDCVIICAPVLYYRLDGGPFAMFRLVFKNVSQCLANRSVSIPVAPKTGKPKPERRERIAAAKLKEEEEEKKRSAN